MWLRMCNRTFSPSYTNAAGNNGNLHDYARTSINWG